MSHPELDAVIWRALELVAAEENARETGRLLELDPRRVDEAAVLFGVASQLREQRLALLERCGIR